MAVGIVEHSKRLVRERLRSFASSGATILSGSAGSGKSVLLAHWADAEHQDGRRVRWVSETGAPAESDSVIVDDLDPSDPASARMLKHVVDHLSPSSRLVIATRSPVFDVVAQHPWLSGATVVDARSLEFTPEEIGALLDLKGVSTDRERVEDMHRATGGAAWLIDACVSRLIRHREIEAGRVPGSVSPFRAAIFDDVVREAVNGRVRRAPLELDLLKSSLLPEFDVEEIRGLLSNDAALTRLSGEGWFDWLSDGRLRLPKAVRAVVRGIGRGDHEAELAPLVSAAVKRRRDAGDLLGAWQLSWEAQDENACWAVVKAAGATLDVTAMWRSCVDIRSVPWPESTTRPELYIWSLAFRTGGTDDAHSRAEAVEILPPIASPEGKDGPEQLFVRGLAVARGRWSGDLPGAVVEARRVRKLWAAMRPRVSPHRRGVGVLALFNVGLTFVLAFRWAEALGCFTEASRHAERMGATDVAAVYAADEAMVRALLGDVAGAALALQRAKDLAPEMDERLLDTGYFLAKAIVALESGIPSAAKDAIATARTISHASELWPLVEAVAVVIDVLNGSRVTVEAFERIQDGGVEKGHAPLADAGLEWMRQFLQVCVGGSPDPGTATLPDGDPFVLATLGPLLSNDLVRATRALRGQEPPDPLAARAQMSRALYTAATALKTKDAEGLALALTTCATVTRASRVATPVRLLTPGVRAELAEVATQQGLEDLAELLNDTARHPSAPQLEHRAPVLTGRERRVLSVLADVGSISATAAALEVSPNTVKTQLQGIYRKLRTSSRVEAITRAAAWGLLD